MKAITTLLTLVLTFFSLVTPVLAAPSATVAPSTQTASACSTTQGVVNLKAFDIKGNIVANVSNIPWIENENVHLAMNNAVSVSPSFSYSGSSSCPYGLLVTNINNVTPQSNQYWALYINGIRSNFGVDTAILKKNDLITWVIKSFAK